VNSWQLRERALATLAREVGYVRKPHGDRLRVALAFPNTYWVGMSNLGFQTVYDLFNREDDIVCERIFLPPKQELAEMLASKSQLLTLESQSPAGEFDVIRIFGVVRVGLRERADDAAARGCAGRSRSQKRTTSPGCDWRCGDVRQPRTARAVR
jgi:hypothetical protein